MKGLDRRFVLFAVLAALSAAMFTSCDKGKAGNAKLLEVMGNVSDETGDGVTTTFEYDAQNRLVKIYEDNTSDCNVSKIIAYGSDDSITVKTVCEGVWEKAETFVRKGDKIERLYVTGEDSGKDTFTVNNDGYIVSDQYGNKYQYQDGNRICEDDENIACTYDDKKTPFSECATPKWLIATLLEADYVNKNNVINSGDKDGRGVDNEYEYDGDGFPIRQTYRWYNGEGDGGTAVRAFTYRGGTKDASDKATAGGASINESTASEQSDETPAPGSTITVSTAREFRQALGSDRIIELKPGRYVISSYDSDELDSEGNPSKLPAGVSSWRTDELIITGIKNLTIRGVGRSNDGKLPEIVIDPRVAYVLTFVNCSDIVIDGVAAGHTDGGECAGGVFYFKESSRITVNGAEMYGSGTDGINSEKSSDVKVTNSRIYQCSECIMRISGGGNVAFEKCTFDNNRGGTWSLVNGSIDAAAPLKITDCVFKDNTGDAFFGVSGKAVVTNSKFIGNNVKRINESAGYATFSNCAFDNAITDARDGKAYKFVKIGNKVWTAENMGYTTSRSWCYGDDEATCTQLGRLYSWDAAKKACPTGWRLPNRNDVEDMMDAVAGEKTDANSYVTWNGAGKKLKAEDYVWGTDANGRDGRGTDVFGFTAMPGGERVAKDGSYRGSNELGTWWVNGSSDETPFRLQLNRGDDAYYAKGNDQKDYGYSVRCVRDE